MMRAGRSGVKGGITTGSASDAGRHVAVIGRHGIGMRVEPRKKLH
jgi:hypothetical protein